ncbi:Uncharacterised protein [Mycoplasmoides gallisepticum]|uniref:Uncharacterized protein n=1 Tax=Mycoplasmoides gallisepticum TaxID=2096 RepID=A0A3B0PBB1_MYCGL|nr:Uncharacterised protein [Mycoplasmoides gallisepticum]
MNSDLSLALVQALGFRKAPFVGAGTIIDSAVHLNAGNTDEAFNNASSNAVLLSAS